MSVDDATVTEKAIGFPDPGSPLDLASYEYNRLGLYLTPVINTYCQRSQDPFLVAPAATFKDVSNALGVIFTGVKAKYASYFSTVKMKGAPWNPHYVLSIPWIVIDLTSCKILFMAEIAAFWLRKRTLAPEIFGYVSSLTRDIQI